MIPTFPLAKRLGLMADAMVSAVVGPKSRFFSRERVDEVVLLLREAEKALIDVGAQRRIDYSNHHNALLCAYCNPDNLVLTKPPVVSAPPAEVLVRALTQIRDDATGLDCPCDHATDDCCVRVGEYCPVCIAAVALLAVSAPPAQAPTDEKEKATRVDGL